MKSIRKGNDIEVRWTIFAESGNGSSPYSLDGKDLSLYARFSTARIVQVKDFTVSGNVLTWTFRGKDQRYAGDYRLTLVENEGKDGMKTVDKCEAFRLVECSCETGGEDNNNIESVSVELSSNIEVGAQGSTGIDLSGYVSTFAQNFSEEQKEQARKNIGTVSADYIVSVLEEIKQLIKNGDQGGAIAVLDNAILDLAILA